MRRIFTSTSLPNLFGIGLRGFTDGNAIVGLPPTRLNADWFNNVQESIARTIESNGATLPLSADPVNYWQLDDAVGRQFYMSTVDTGGVLHGLRFTETDVLEIQLTTGSLHQEGRRYVITESKIAAAGGPITLTANSDNWIYIAAADGEPGVPNRGIFYAGVTVTDIGDPAPGSSFGFGFLIMRLTTDADSITAVRYFNQGPKILHDENSGLWLRRPDAPAARTDVLPIGTVAIGVHQHPELDAQFYAGAPVESIASELRYLRTVYSSLAPQAWLIEGTIHGSTSAGGSSNVAILSSAPYVEGATADVVVRGCARNIDTPAVSYVFQREYHVTHDGATWDLDGSGTGGPSREHGTSAILDGVTVEGNISGGVLRAAFTGHSTDALRWFCYVSTVITSDAP